MLNVGRYIIHGSYGIFPSFWGIQPLRGFGMVMGAGGFWRSLSRNMKEDTVTAKELTKAGCPAAGSIGSMGRTAALLPTRKPIENQDNYCVGEYIPVPSWMLLVFVQNFGEYDEESFVI